MTRHTQSFWFRLHPSKSWGNVFASRRPDGSVTLGIAGGEARVVVEPLERVMRRPRKSRKGGAK